METCAQICLFPDLVAILVIKEINLNLTYTLLVLTHVIKTRNYVVTGLGHRRPFYRILIVVAGTHRAYWAVEYNNESTAVSI